MTCEFGGLFFNVPFDVDGDCVFDFLQNDYDGDGTLDIFDPDADNDGVDRDRDSDDTSEWTDYDGDGIPDKQDRSPYDPQSDYDRDGILNGADLDGVINKGFFLGSSSNPQDENNNRFSDEYESELRDDLLFVFNELGLSDELGALTEGVSPDARNFMLTVSKSDSNVSLYHDVSWGFLKKMIIDIKDENSYIQQVDLDLDWRHIGEDGEYVWQPMITVKINDSFVDTVKEVYVPDWKSELRGYEITQGENLYIILYVDEEMTFLENPDLNQEDQDRMKEIAMNVRNEMPTEVRDIIDKGLIGPENYDESN